MNTNSRPTSLVLTDWAADVDNIRVDRTGFINQLLLLSLMYDQVLIQDELLVLSDIIPNWFFEKEGESIWREILDIGSVVILRHPKAAYPDSGLAEMSIRNPLFARAQQISRYGTKGDSKFSSSEIQERFYKITELGMSNNTVCWRETGEKSKLPIMPAFTESLISVLENSKYNYWRKVQLSSWNSEDLDRLLRLVLEPERILTALADSARDPRAIFESTKPVFNRSLAYQAATLFEEQKKQELQRVIQSVFAEPFARREGAIARYGGRMRTPPLPSALGILENGPCDLVEIQASITLPIYLPELNSNAINIIGDVRQSDAGKRLRSAVSSLGTARDFNVQRDAWSAVSTELASRLIKPQTFGLSLHSVGHELYKSTMVAAAAHSIEAVVAGQGSLQHALVAGLISGGRDSVLGLTFDAFHDFLRISRDNVKLQDVARAIESAVDFQCTWIAQQDHDAFLDET